MQNQNSKFKVDLKERSYRTSIEIIQLIDTLPKDPSTQIIANQLLRSATSTGANIIEAQASSSKRDFTNFFTYSLKSANESRYWLGLLRDAKGIDGQKMDWLSQETKELANILGSSILTLKGKRSF